MSRSRGRIKVRWAGKALAIGVMAAVLATAGLAIAQSSALLNPDVEAPCIQPPVLEKMGLTAMSYPKVLVLLLLAAGAMYVVNWSMLDIEAVNTNRAVWGGLVLAGAVLGLAAVILIPLFLVGLPIGLILFGGATLAYTTHRNALVEPPMRVLTGAHLERIHRRLSGERPARITRHVMSAAGRDVIFMGLDDMPLSMPAENQGQVLAVQAIERLLQHAVRHRATAIGYLAKPQKAKQNKV